VGGGGGGKKTEIKPLPMSDRKGKASPAISRLEKVPRSGREIGIGERSFLFRGKTLISQEKDDRERSSIVEEGKKVGFHSQCGKDWSVLFWRKRGGFPR